MKLKLFFLSILFCSLSVSAQYTTDDSEDTREKFVNKLYVGGELGLSFGNVYSNVNVAPIVGYEVSEPFSLGIGGKYQWFRFFNDSYSFYGASVFGKYLLGDQFLLHAEVEGLNVFDVNQFSPNYGQRTWINTIWLGGGYKQNFAPNSYFQIMALYDVLDEQSSPYKFQYIFGPTLPIIFRGGIVIGL